MTGAGHDDRLNELTAKRAETEGELAKFKEQWEKEKDLTTRSAISA